MRKIVSAFLLLVALAIGGDSLARMTPMLFGPQASGGGGGACSTQADACISASNAAGYNLGSASNNVWLATRIVADADETICKITLYLQKVGSPTFTLTAKLYTDVTNAPGLLVGTGSASVEASSVEATYSGIQFSSVSATLTNATVYWIVITASAVGDASNYIQAHGDTACDTGGTNELMQSANGTSWGSVTVSRGLRHSLTK